DHPDFAEDSSNQEESFEAQLRYLELAQEARRQRLKPLLVVQDYLAQFALRPPSIPLWLPPAQLVRTMQIPIVGPLDVLDARGNPLIRPDARERVRSRLGMLSPQPAAPPVASAAPADKPAEPEKPKN